MKKTFAALTAISCFVFFLGAYAPVLPSKNFYINDYAAVIDQSHRSAMLETARNLYEKTGAQLVVLTVQSLGGRDMDSFAREVFSGWKIGGEAGDGALILTLHTERETDFKIYVGEGLSGALTQERIEPIGTNRMGKYFSRGDFSAGLYEGFAAAAGIVFEYYGEESVVVKPEKGGYGSPADYAIIAVASLFIMFRAWRVSAKYRKKYSNNYAYKPRTYSRGRRSDEDDYPSGFGGIIKMGELKQDGEDMDNAEIESAEQDEDRQN